MAGANYMGGRRNSARARTKDATGRAQKSHFMKQRHQILARGLRLDDKDHRPTQSARIEEIGFAHAKRDLEQHGLSSSKPSSRRRPPALGLPSSSSPSSGKRGLLRNSKILEDLDINEPSGLRATVQCILRQPDLAGINRLSVRSVTPKNTRSSLEAARKRQKSGEETPTDSSSSFRYDSPTRKDVSGRPQLLTQRRLTHFSRASNDQSYSVSHSQSRLSLNPTEISAAGNDSLGSSLDRLSMMQEVGSSSSYPDSGFSELPFSDIGDKDHSQSRSDISVHVENSVEIGRQPPSPALTSIHDHPERQSPKEPRGYIPQDLLDVTYQHEIDEALGIASEPYQTHSRASPDRVDLNNWFALDDLSAVQHAAAASMIPSDWSSREYRYGVGYVPSDSTAEYKSFVPLTTMLPSYSDEDLVDDDSNHGSKENTLADSQAELYIPMDVDVLAGTDNLRNGEKLSVSSPTPEANNVNRSVSNDNRSPGDESIERTHSETDDSPDVALENPDASSSRSSWWGTNQATFQMPPPRFTTSPTRRLPSMHRSRFTFQNGYSVSTVLSGSSGRERGSFVSPVHPRSSYFSVLSDSPRLSSTVASHRSNNVLVADNSSRDINNPSPDYACSPCTLAQKPPSSGSPPVSPVSKALDTNLAPSPIPDLNEEVTPSPRPAEVPVSSPRVFDGPDLFAGDNNDDDDE